MKREEWQDGKSKQIKLCH